MFSPVRSEDIILIELILRGDRKLERSAVKSDLHNVLKTEHHKLFSLEEMKKEKKTSCCNCLIRFWVQACFFCCKKKREDKRNTQISDAHQGLEIASVRL